MRSTAETGQTSYGVLVTTLNKLYQFYATLTTSGSANRVDERPLLLPLFHSYLNAKGYFYLIQIISSAFSLIFYFGISFCREIH